MAAELDAVAAAPDGPSAARAAVAVEPAEGAVARPLAGAAEPPVAEAALASPSAEPDAAVGAAQPGAAARSERRPAEQVLEARQFWAAAGAAAARLAFAPFPERPVWPQAPEPSQLSADPLEVLELPVDLAGQVWRWDWAGLEQAPSRAAVQEARPSCQGLARHWVSATPGPAATH